MFLSSPPMSRFLSHLRRCWWWVLLVVLVAMYWGVRTGRQASRSIEHDFGVYYLAGKAVLDGGDIYHVDLGPQLTFKYAPIVAVAFAPLAMLDPVTARVVWCWIDLLLLAALMRSVRTLSGGDELPADRRRWWYPIVGLAMLGHMVAQLQCGQSTTLWLLLSVLAIRSFERGQSGRSALCWSAACSAKCVPLALAPGFIRPDGQFRSMMILAGGLLFVAIVPATILGWDGNARLLMEWPGHLFETSTFEQLSRPENQSVLAQYVRWTSRDGDVSFATTLWVLSAGVAMAGILRVRDRPDEETNAYRWSLLFLFMTVFNPLAWRYHFLGLVVPYGWVVARLLRDGRVNDGRWWLLGIAASLNTIPLPTFIFEQGGRLWGTLFLWWAVEITRREREPARIEIMPARVGGRQATKSGKVYAAREPAART